METIELIYASIISALPAITAIVGVVIAGIKFIGQVKGIKKDINNGEEARKLETQELRAALNVCLEENAELKQTIRKVIAKLDAINESDVEV